MPKKAITKDSVNRKWLLSFESGKLFDDKKLKGSELTASNYTNNLFAYCQYLHRRDMISGTIENPNLEDLLLFKPEIDEVLDAREQHKKLDANKGDNLLSAYIVDNTVPYTLRKNTAIAVKSFYAAVNRELKRETARDFITEKKRIKEQKSPSLKDCIEIEKACSNARDRFLVWLLESSPVRQGSLGLTFEDLKPTNDPEVPLWFEIPAENLKGHGKGKYAKAHHVGFLHAYTVQKFRAYQEELKGKGLPFSGSAPLFQSYKQNVNGSEKGHQIDSFNYVLYMACCRCYGTHPEEKKGKIINVPNVSYSPHDFRDLLSSILGRPEIKADKDKNIVKFLLSHAPQGIEANYENYVKNKHATKEAYNILFDVYKQCLPYLLPPTVEKVERLEAEKSEQKETIELQELQLSTMQEQQESRDRAIEQQQQETEALKAQIATLTAMFQKLTTQTQSQSQNQQSNQQPQIILQSAQ